jgi:hypothetical protein
MKPGIYLCTLFLFLATAAYPQADSVFLSRAATLLAKNAAENPIEKVYLQLDKPYYAAGDDIWFKAYVTAGPYHKLSGISAVLNVELINGANKIQQSIKLPLISGLGWGDFRLADTIKTGYYHIRAYTRWMRNAGSAYFYDRAFYVGNAIYTATSEKMVRKHTKTKKAEQAGTQSLSAKTDVQFFPESGSLVYGVSSVVAFKAVGDDGLGKNIRGVVTDNDNNEVARFDAKHLGMGEFDLLPVSGKTYKALITFADGSEKGIDLPKPKAMGYVMHIDNSDPLFIEVKIEAGKEMQSSTAGETINLLAQSGGRVCYAARSNSLQSSFTTMIPKSKFPSGIAQFTLFSGKGEPLNERLVFIESTGQLNLAVKPDGTNFKTRDRMRLDVTAKDKDGKPVFGNFSVAVTDETKVPVDEAAESTIFSNLLLTSDIKGYVENPNYYFASDNADAKQNLDVLMLTQGYRRFEWAKILADSIASPKYQPETSLEISGRLMTLGGRRGIPHGRVSLLSSTAGFAMLDTTADENGHFAFTNLQFKDSSKFVIQAKKNKNSKNLIVDIDSLSPPPITTRINFSNHPDSSFSTYLDNSKQVYDEQIKYGIKTKVRTLQGVTIRDKKVELNSSNLNGPGNADQILLMKNISLACPDIIKCLDGKLMGVFIQYDLYGVGYPCILVEGHPVRMKIKLDGFDIDAETLSSLPTEIFESVEVLKTGAYTSVYGGDGYNGIILINSKRGNFSLTSYPNIVHYMPKGYYKAREFYSPKYDDPKTNKEMKDLRSTIYWNPDVATDKTGNACLEYFNADGKGTYRVVIEGIDANGNLGRQVYRYKVE